MNDKNNVQRLRWDKNISLEHLARMSGVSKSTIQRIENFEQEPNRTQMILLAKALHQPIHIVFDLEHL